MRAINVMEKIPDKYKQQLQEAAKEFGRKTDSPADIVITHEDYNLASLVSFHEGASWGYSLCADQLTKANQEIERLKETHERESRLIYKKDTELIIAQEETGRLKGLVEKAHDSGYDSYEKYSKGLSWLGFKTDNGL